MITFCRLGELGRLGNQLYQYAALKSLSLKRGYKMKIPNPSDKSWHGQECLLNNFNIESDFLTKKDKTLYVYKESNPFIIDKNFFYMRDSTDLNGFFQSIYYFDEFQEQIKKELTPKKEFIEKASNKIKFYKKKFDCDIVSIHIRRGDNTDNTDSSQVELNNFYCKDGEDKLNQNSEYYKYITEAMKNFQNVKFLIFSGGKRGRNENTSDLEWCKKSFVGDQFLFAEGNTVMEDFSLIASCDGNILSHVSSFGWWAAFLNKNSKLTIAPNKYHPDLPDFTHRYKFYPQHWKLI
jgi:hypothetical protein